MSYIFTIWITLGATEHGPIVIQSSPLPGTRHLLPVPVDATVPGPHASRCRQCLTLRLLYLPQHNQRLWAASTLRPLQVSISL